MNKNICEIAITGNSDKISLMTEKKGEEIFLFILYVCAHENGSI